MKANELRIGNWVEQPNDGVTKVTAILNDLQIKTETGYIDKYCRPIPLTGEWLLKFGFNYNAYTGSWIKNEFDFDLDKTVNGGVDGFDVYLKNEDFVIRTINHVHQLQNLYFALTGEELTLKEKQDA